jgi:hypothetical protein
MKIDININHTLDPNFCRKRCNCLGCIGADSNTLFTELLTKKKHIPFENIDTLPESKIDPIIQQCCDSMLCIGCGKRQDICRQRCDWNNWCKKCGSLCLDGIMKSDNPDCDCHKKSYSKEMAEADCRLLGLNCKMPKTETRIVSKYPSTMSDSLVEHILTKIIKGI